MSVGLNEFAAPEALQTKGSPSALADGVSFKPTRAA